MAGLKCKIEMVFPEIGFNSGAGSLRTEINLDIRFNAASGRLDEGRCIPPEHCMLEQGDYYLPRALLDAGLPVWSWAYITEFEMTPCLTISLIE
jgi:hypothetical protein